MNEGCLQRSRQANRPIIGEPIVSLRLPPMLPL